MRDTIASLVATSGGGGVDFVASVAVAKNLEVVAILEHLNGHLA